MNKAYKFHSKIKKKEKKKKIINENTKIINDLGEDRTLDLEINSLTP